MNGYTTTDSYIPQFLPPSDPVMGPSLGQTLLGLSARRGAIQPAVQPMQQPMQPQIQPTINQAPSPTTTQPSIAMPTAIQQPQAIPTAQPSPLTGMPPTGAAPPGVPPTGLIGAEQALTTIMPRATGLLSTTAQEQFTPFTDPGQAAAQQQAALSGALGPEAQAQAIAEMQPVSDYLTEEAERAILRNQAAIGGLGGGNVQQELARQAQALAAETYQQQFENLGQVATRGLEAAGQVGALGTSEAALMQDLANQLAAGRTSAGMGIAEAIGGTTSALAGLTAGQGADIAGQVGTTTSNLANLLSGLGVQEADLATQLASLLSGVTFGEAQTYAGLGGIPGVQQTSGQLGEIGQLASGIGTAVSAF